MKRFVCIMTVLCLMICTYSVTVSAALSAQIKTGSMLLVDRNTGKELFSKSPDTVRSMGSVTKLMTYILTVEKVKDPANTKIKIKSSLFSGISPDASMANLADHNGQYMSVLDILYGLMLPSGCDAAVVLADYLTGGKASDFPVMMNNKAAALGCADTHYADPHGLSDSNRTTAKDTYKIFSYAMELPYFREITGSSYHYYECDSTVPVYQTNYLVSTTEGGMYFYPYCFCGKTGYTTAAGKCLASAAKKGDNEYVCIALGGEYSSATGYINYAMTDTAALYKLAFDTYTENVYIDIPAEYTSVQPGEKKQIGYSVDTNGTGLPDTVTWTSSDESIASVDENGVITAKKTGMAVITAQTETGNIDMIKAACGFYNGILVTSRNGDFSSGAIEPIDWKAVKASGIDYAMIRCGWSWTEDAAFEENIAGAAGNGIPFGITFASYADSKSEAVRDAEYVASLLEKAEYAGRFTIPVVYDLVTYADNTTRGGREMAEIIRAFREAAGKLGLDIAVLAKKKTLTNLETAGMTDPSLKIWEAYYPWLVDLSVIMTYNGNTMPFMWEYKTDGYIPGAVRDDTKHTSQNLMYMSGAYASLYDTELTYTADSSGIVLSWTEDTDCPAFPEAFRVYREKDGEEVLFGIVPADTFTFTDLTAVQGGEYTYTVVPVFTDPLDSSYETRAGAVSASVTVPVDDSVISLLIRLFRLLMEMIRAFSVFFS